MRKMKSELFTVYLANLKRKKKISGNKLQYKFVSEEFRWFHAYKILTTAEMSELSD